MNVHRLFSLPECEERQRRRTISSEAQDTSTGQIIPDFGYGESDSLVQSFLVLRRELHKFGKNYIKVFF